MDSNYKNEGNNDYRWSRHEHFRKWHGCNDPKHKDRKIWSGIAIILLGVVILSHNLNFLSYELQRYVFTWEVILIALGILFILNGNKRSTGIILLLIGGVFYMKNVLNMIDFNFWEVFWPVILIFAGIMILFRHRLDKTPEKKNTLTDEHTIDELALFGGGDRVVTSQQFQGGKVTTIFGGLNYDMLRAKLDQGDNVIDVFCLFGGMKLIVPENWTVKIRVMSFFGGFSDKHRFKVQDNDKVNNAQLIIKGIVIFGGGEIKSYFD